MTKSTTLIFVFCLICISAFSSAPAVIASANPEDGNNLAPTLAANNLELKQNFPNPFNKNTSIGFNSTQDQKGEFKVFDILGNLITKRYLDVNKGFNQITFERDDLKPGLYFFSIEVGGAIVVKKMTIRD